ncbi:MAG: D-alanyl-D-alanine carboxypeptidase/D-alanyl-D-alanine-endopeptidase [Actinobacteria bacterium]|nr:D-alanyl-D-alanine carboxypeptidase/D-alanyl-D-alanine-endopeptidase [Actinomycetota bacterium]
MGLRGSFAALAACVTLLAPAAAAASAPTLDVQLERALATRPASPWTSAGLVVDLATGQTLFSRAADASLEPASNEKLPVTFAALTELGPAYRFRTEVLGEGHRAGDTWVGNLVLKGFGDPSLTSHRLALVADELWQDGIRRVTGHVVGDDSWFDADRGVAGWRPEFYGIESPPLSALVVDRAQRNDKLVRDAPLAAAAAFDRALWARGIAARGAVARAARGRTTLLATTKSPQLWRLLQVMDRDSDNFTAELVLKELGAEKLGEGSSAAGAQVVVRALQAAGIPLTGVRIVDGSGLSRDDRATPRELGALLAAMWAKPSVRDVVWRSLATPGTPGTLEHRLLKQPARALVRAKTGTTDIASALSGYVGTQFAFVVLQNGDPVDWQVAHAAQDRFVTALARRVTT